MSVNVGKEFGTADHGRVANPFDRDDARRAARLLQGGKLDGLSFGYRVREAGESGGLRELRELELIEVSLVAEPMQPRARVHAVEVENRVEKGMMTG